MAKIISLVLQKGGTGKTSTSVNISTCLNLLNKKTLLVDMDSQANATSNLSAPKGKSLMDYLTEKNNIEDIIIKTKYCDVIPSNFEMSDFDVELKNRFIIGLEKFLRKTLDKVKKEYDYIIIDCPPALNFQTINSLVASDSTLVVLEPSDFNVNGLTQFIKVYNMISEEYNLKIEGILFNRVNKNTNEFKNKYQQVYDIFPDLVYDFFIPSSQSVPNSQSSDISMPEPCVIKYPNSSASIAYKKLAETIIRNEVK